MTYMLPALRSVFAPGAQIFETARAKGMTAKLLENGHSNHEEPPIMHATMLDPRELAAFGIAFAALVVSLNREALGLEEGPAFRMIYAVTLAAEYAIWADEYCGHVHWLNSSSFSSRRGLGKWASPLYGLFGVPALSTGWFAIALILQIVALLVASVVPEVTMVAFLLSCVMFAHTFWNRQNIGGHGGLPALHTLFCLCLMVEGNERFTIACVQLILAVSYLASALCKLVTSLFIQQPRQWWGSGDGLKFYLLDCVSVRPMRGVRLWVRSGILAAGPELRPALDMAMNSALLFELAVPALICLWVEEASLLLFAFHYVVWFLFDIDFVSFWAPSLIALAIDRNTSSDLLGIAEAFQESWHAVPIRTVILIAYTAAQVAVSLSIYDLNPRKGEILPFSAYPMFEEAARLFQEDQAMALVLRVPTAVPIPEPYYLRMQALATNPSEHFIWGPQVLDAVGQRTLVVGIPRQAEPRLGKKEVDYAGGVWRPQPKPGTRLHSCATGIASMCGKVSDMTNCSTCTIDATGSHALNHERECEATVGAVILVGNVDSTLAMPQVERLLRLLVSMKPADGWQPSRMRELLQAYDDAEVALATCPRAPAERKEITIDFDQSATAKTSLC